MEIRFNVTGAERKTFVKAVSELTDEAAVYQFAPSFAFTVGPYTIDKVGTLSFDPARVCERQLTNLLTRLTEQGFEHEDIEHNPFEEGDATGAAFAEADGLPDTIIIELPGEDFSDAAFDNLTRLTAGKAALIRKAIGGNLADGAAALPVLREDGKISFPWFRFGMEPEAVAAWSRFVSALCATAKKQKRVILKERAEDGSSEKFAFRCFLLKLGFIGDEYKEARKILLACMSGNGSHKTGDSRKKPAAVNEGFGGDCDGFAESESVVYAENL
jgi:hypothetical protein